MYIHDTYTYIYIYIYISSYIRYDEVKCETEMVLRIAYLDAEADLSGLPHAPTKHAQPMELQGNVFCHFTGQAWDDPCFEVTLPRDNFPSERNLNILQTVPC